MVNASFAKILTLANARRILWRSFRACYYIAHSDCVPRASIKAELLRDSLMRLLDADCFAVTPPETYHPQRDRHKVRSSLRKTSEVKHERC